MPSTSMYFFSYCASFITCSWCVMVGKSQAAARSIAMAPMPVNQLAIGS